MIIDSRVQEVAREMLSSSVTGNTATGRPRSVTSGPIENSAGRADTSAHETSNKGMHQSLKEETDVKGAVEKLNKLVQAQRTDVSFSVDEDAHATVIKFFKKETGELIKQFPPEEILAMKAKISKSVGWLIDSKA
jgi:flagellar protein FlaG